MIGHPKISKDFLIVALDYSNFNEAKKIIDILDDSVTFYKVGMELFYAEGFKIINYIKNKNKNIFLDLKINDIPQTIFKTVSVLAQQNVDLLTLFCDAEGIVAAKNAIEQYKSHNEQSVLKILNVTVLTSSANSTSDIHIQKNNQETLEKVIHRATLTQQNGGDGIICSGLETEEVRKILGDNFLIINPGIRLPEHDSADQKRIVTPSIAYKSGANHIVVGRPITQALDPLKAIELIYNNLIN